MVVERVKKLLAVRSALEKIQNLLVYPIGYGCRLGNARVSKRQRGRLALVLRHLHHAINPFEIRWGCDVPYLSYYPE